MEVQLSQLAIFGIYYTHHGGTRWTMTDWEALRDSAKEPDTLEKIVGDLTDAVLPLANGMKRIHTTEQLKLLEDELQDLHLRVLKLRLRKKYEVEHGG